MKLLYFSASLALLLFAACQNSTTTSCDPATAPSGTCGTLQCTGTMRDCKNGAADGCETDTAADADNCGACGTKCPMPANGEAACIDGVCGVRTCGTRFRDCNASATDGCEIDTFRDASNCGACGNVCAGGANAAGVCILGKCQLACQAAYLDCNSDPSDGCETNGASDIANCGNCGNTCTAVGATNAACAAGSCISTMCTGTNRTCQSGPIDSCETDTATNVTNCGTCGKQCAAPANATAGCAASNCGIGMCNTGYGDCDNASANGCETNTTNNVNNCNGCGKACPALANASINCVASTCGLNTCNAGYGNCDNVAANGCEVNVTSDAKNCNSCGNVCPAPANATPGCTASTCGIGSCNTGYGDCDNAAANGCETNTTNSTANCGACGKPCTALANAAASCAASTCGLGTCNAGYDNCDKVDANGCEVNLNSDNNNCGTCGKVCGAGLTCSGGSCVIALYQPVGPQTNVPVTTVTSAGWTQCFLQTYDIDLPTASVIAACSKAKLMLACRPTGSTTLSLLAWAPRADALFDEAKSATGTHDANGSSWYFSTNWSWGFLKQGDVVNRNSCDIGVPTNANLRLCWHTGQNVGGYRCGAQEGLNSSNAYERLVFQAD